MKIEFSILFLLIAAITFAQQDANVQDIASNESPKHVIYMSAGTIILYSSFGLNYDFRMAHSDKGFFKSYYLNLETGLFREHSIGTISEGFAGNLRAIGLTGARKGHFETTLGVTMNIETEINGEDQAKQTLVLPDVAIGYRYQNKYEPTFRVGIGFPRLAYIGFGYSF